MNAVSCIRIVQKFLTHAIFTSRNLNYYSHMLSEHDSAAYF